jgi:hypothetical protein
VSHQPQRKEKDCLNCGTIVQGHYCYACGQENIVPHQSFGGLTKHFVYDIFHFDGKFFDTLIPLFFKPGLVAKEYTKGKRVKFLDPIRMYLFTSAVFFLIFFSFAKPNVGLETDEFLTVEKRVELANELKEEAKKEAGDTTIPKQIALLLDTNNRKQITLDDLEWDKESFVSFDDKSYSTLGEYDSIQKSLPANKKDGWLKSVATRKGIELNNKYRGKSDEGLRDFADGFLHRMPYLLFLSLPFFALILKLLHVRRKNFFYSDHAVFTLYHYIFSFLLLMLIFTFNSLKNWLDARIFGYLIAALIIGWFVHLFKGLRNFYGQSFGKTLLKFLLLNTLGLMIVMLLFVIFVFFSIFQM